LIVHAAAATFALGLVVTGMLLVLRHVIGAVLDQPTPSFLLLAVLGTAMAVGGTTSVFINAGVARGVARPWPPPAVGMLVVIVCWSVRPSATAFAYAFLAAQTAAMLLSGWVTLKGRRGSSLSDGSAAVGPSSADTSTAGPATVPEPAVEDPPSARELVLAMSPYYALPPPGRWSGFPRERPWKIRT
jgi:hypothetical protein